MDKKRCTGIIILNYNNWEDTLNCILSVEKYNTSNSKYVIVDNGVAKLEIRMRENCSFHAKNLNFPALPDLEYTDMMIIPNMLGIIDQLKNIPPIEFKDFASRWDEIRTITLANVVQNRVRQKER